MSEKKSKEEIRELFYSIYNNDSENLKFAAKVLYNSGVGYMEILQLAMKELKLPMGEAIMLLEIPDYTG